MESYILILISAALINNFILAKFLGLCPFIGVSKRTETALGMGMAVVFVMTMASIVTWVVYRFLLAPTELNIFYILMGDGKTPQDFDFTFLNTIVFILVIATFVQLVEMFTMKVVPSLYESLGIYLPLITTNCAVLGVALLNIKEFGGLGAGESFVKSVLQGFGAGTGFLIVIYLMSGIRERIERTNSVPHLLRGVPIAFICAALMALAFMGFAGLKF